LRVLAFEAIHQRRIPVQMIEVLEKAEAEDLGQVGVRLRLRHTGRHLDGDLLEADRRLERRLIGGIQPVSPSVC
jgi:hypothetical protein